MVVVVGVGVDQEEIILMIYTWNEVCVLLGMKCVFHLLTISFVQWKSNLVILSLTLLQLTHIYCQTKAAGEMIKPNAKTELKTIITSKSHSVINYVFPQNLQRTTTSAKYFQFNQKHTSPGLCKQRRIEIYNSIQFNSVP